MSAVLYKRLGLVDEDVLSGTGVADVFRVVLLKGPPRREEHRREQA